MRAKCYAPVIAIIKPDTHENDLEKSDDLFERALAKGKFWAFIFVFIGGFLTSLTPCIFPMIPITISIIGARSSKNKRSRSFILSLTYVLGIAFTYSMLGVIAASTGAVCGAAPWQHLCCELCWTHLFRNGTKYAWAF